MHNDQLHVDVATARQLIDEQFPQWQDAPISAIVTDATVNSIFRIGSHLTARFPLRADDTGASRTMLEAEAAANRELGFYSSVPTPSPVAIGAPGHGYPLHWSVQTWLPGQVATPDYAADSPAFALDLASFIGGLRRADTNGRRFSGEGRGGRLTDQDEWMETCLRASDGLVDVRGLRREIAVVTG